jgi:hypothetical protein
MTVRNNQWPEEYELDPRWEVQPEVDDAPRSHPHLVRTALGAIVLIVAVLSWLALNP